MLTLNVTSPDGTTLTVVATMALDTALDAVNAELWSAGLSLAESADTIAFLNANAAATVRAERGFHARANTGWRDAKHIVTGERHLTGTV